MKSECALLCNQKAVRGGDIFTDSKFPCHISFFVYTFYRFLDFNQNLNMTFQDFHNIQSSHNVIAESFKYSLFVKLSKNFGFHSNQCKMQMLYARGGFSDFFLIHT